MTVEEHFIYLPKLKEILLFARLTSDHVCLFIARNQLLQ